MEITMKVKENHKEESKKILGWWRFWRIKSRWEYDEQDNDRWKKL